MSVQIVDGIGRNVLCKWCNHNLILNSKTDYCKCENCGGSYIDPISKPVEIKSAYNWYYFKQLLLTPLQKKNFV